MLVMIDIPVTDVGQMRNTLPKKENRMELPKMSVKFKCCKCGTVQTASVATDDIWVIDGYNADDTMTRDICATVDCKKEDCGSGENITLRHFDWS
jgi:hypothetical protein